jgi:hypothetical protein
MQFFLVSFMHAKVILLFYHVDSMTAFEDRTDDT